MTLNCCEIERLLDLSAVHFKFVQVVNHAGVLMKDHFVGVVLFWFGPLDFGVADFKEPRQSFLLRWFHQHQCFCTNEHMNV